MNNKKGLIKKIAGAGIAILIIGGILVEVDVYYNKSIETAKETATKLEAEKVKVKEEAKAKAEERAKAEEQAKVEEQAKAEERAKTEERVKIKVEQAAQISKSMAEEQAKDKEQARDKEKAIEEAVSSVHSVDPNDPAFQDEMRKTMEKAYKELEEDFKKRGEELNQQIAEEELRRQIAEMRIK